MGAISTTFTTEEQLQIAAIAGQLKILASGGGSSEQFQSVYNQLEELKNSLLGTEGNLSDEEQARHDSLLSKILEIEARMTVAEQDRYSNIMKAISDLASKIENQYYPQIAAKLSGIETKIDNLDYNSTTPVSQLTYTVPTIEDTFVYNGQVQTPVLRNFRNTIMTIITETSVTSATNAGEYKITVRIADGFQWEDETTEDKEIPWAIQKATVSIPALSGTFTYNGQEQKPAITNFRDDVSSILTDTSVLAATNAGNYNINVKLNDPDNYTWTDGTTENKTLAWQIAKAASVLSLSANSGSVNYSGTSTFRVASQTGDGALSVASANTNYVTATISDTTITLSGVQANSDATVITVTKAETQNYTGATATYNCVVNKIAGSIKIVTTTNSRYNADTNTLTLDDTNFYSMITLEREGDGGIENWEYYNGAQFVGAAGTPSGKQVAFRIVGIDITPGWGQQPTAAQETRYILCKEGTNHTAASVEIKLVSTARRKVQPGSLKCVKTDLIYNGNEQSIANLNDPEYWVYEVSDSDYKNLTVDNVQNIRTPLDDVNFTDVFEFTSGTSGTLPGTYQAMLELKNTTRFRWTTDPSTSSMSIASWQWKIERYELTANSDAEKELGGYSGAPSSNEADEYIIYDAVGNSAAYIDVAICGPYNGFSTADLNVYPSSTSRGQYTEFRGSQRSGDGIALTYRTYTKFTKVGETIAVYVELTDSGKSKFRISGYTTGKFICRGKAGD